MVRIRTDQSPDQRFGAIVTFDDITELVTAQRTAAWADVARRIAHEIKNPLTPIQLSAERLKRKYLKQIQTDHEIFTECTNTIIRQVGDIGRMVDEFSAFARIPAAEMHEEDLRKIVEAALFSEEFAHWDVNYTLNLPDEPVRIRCDSSHVNRLMMNLLQNAQEAINARESSTDVNFVPGAIHIVVSANDANALLEIIDNGIGLPPDGRERLTEPYVTNRERGTGLGLAIVKKIVEEHGGRLGMEDADGGGARIHLSFPLKE